MKKFTVFETSIIGLLVGVLVSTYVVFLSSTESYIGKILSGISLLPILTWFTVPVEQTLLITFLFIVFVFIVYGFIVGLLVKISNKSLIVVVLAVLIIPVGIFFEQKSGAARERLMREASSASAASAVTIIKRSPTPQSYFGQEAYGDLNADTKDDVAFIIPRDDEKGRMYYMAVSVKGEQGYVGTNLVYIGSKIDPENITIAEGIITIEYLDLADKKSSEPKQFKAQLSDGVLEQIK